MNETMRDVIFMEDILRDVLDLVPGEYLSTAQLALARKIGETLADVGMRIGVLQMALGEAVSMARKGNTLPLEKCYDMLLSIQLKH